MRFHRYAAYGYEPGQETPSTAFCDPLNVAMEELNNALEKAWALGLYNHNDVIAAQNVFDSNAGFWTRKWLTVPFTSQCEDMTAEVRRALDKVRKLVERETGTKPPLLRPEFEETRGEDGGPFGSIPLWVKVAGGGVVALLLLGQVNKFVGFFRAPRRYSGLKR